LANEASVPDKMFLGSDEMGPVILHAFCPRRPPMATGLRPNGAR
jgi:hypothetical protein